MSIDSRPNILDTSLRCLVQPVTWLAVAILLINDHLLKALTPSGLTGKLSDFAGLFFFPFILAALLSVPLDRLRVSPRRAGSLAIVITGVCFALIKTVPAINLFAGALFSRVIGYRTTIVLDPTDVVALIMLLPAWWLWQQPAATNARRRAGWVALLIGAGASIASQPPIPELGIVGLELTQAKVRLACQRQQPFGGDDVVSDIAPAPDGKIWLATSNGAARFDPAAGTWQTYTPNVKEDGISRWNLKTVAIEPDNTAWFTSWGDQTAGRPVYRFDGRFVMPFTQIERVITSTVYDIAIAPDRAIWFAAGNGTYRWDRSADSWTIYPQSGSGEIHFTPDGTVWLSGMGEVNYSLPARISGQIDHWNTRTGTHMDGYDTAQVSADGRIWFGGQRFFDPQTQSWTETVYHDFVNDFVVDSQGQMWLATDRGVILIPDPLRSTPDQWLFFHQQDGLISDKTSSVALGTDNAVWFGGQGGAARCTLEGTEPSATRAVASAVSSTYDSQDGGLTWTSANRPGVNQQTYQAFANRVEARTPWTTSDPNDSQIVYRFTPGQGIERSTDGGNSWISELSLQPLTEAQQKYYRRYTQGNPRIMQGPFESAVDPHTGNVIASMGVEGVLVRTPDGQWQWVNVGDYGHVNPAGIDTLGVLDALELWLGVILAGLLFGVGAWASGCRVRSLNIALILGLAGMVMAYLAGSARTYIAGGIDGMGLWMLGALGIASLAALVAVFRGLTYPMEHRARSIGITFASMLLFWLPFVLWTQNIIPSWQIAMVIATVAALVMLAIQYGSLRRSTRKQTSSAIP
jgi:hypothetical protein